MRYHLRGRHIAAAAAAAVLLAGGASATFTATEAAMPTPSGPFLQSGTNGFPAPNNGAAKNVDEGLGGQAALLTSISGGTNQAGYGLVGVHFPGTFSQLSDVETQFEMTQGKCGGGAPRWVIHLQNPTTHSTAHFWVYFDNNNQPYGGCSAGAEQETNIIGTNSDDGWYVNNANSGESYARVESTYGSWNVQDIEVVLDSGWAQAGELNPAIQQMLVQNLKVNNKSYFPLPN